MGNGIVLRNVEAERARNGLTIEELAQKLGISCKTYQNYVRGSSVPSDKLLVMRGLFGCSVDYLLGIHNEKGDNQG